MTTGRAGRGRSTSAVGRLARYGFADAVTAAALLGPAPTGLGVWDDTAQRPVDATADDLLAALAAAADPTLALRALHRVVVDAGATDLAEQSRLDPVLRANLVAVLGASAALGDDLAVHPDRWTALRDSVEASDVDELMLAVGERTDPIGALRSAYRRALLRVAAADVTGAADLDVTMRRLTSLADATLTAALHLAARECGVPVRFCVIAMGKCGGRELNYVSDVDVIFVADDDADIVAAQSVAARMMEICGQVAWPVDANLRPEGSSGTARAHTRRAPRLLCPVGAHLGVPGAAQGPSGRRRPRPRRAVARRGAAIRLAGGRAPRGRRRRAGDAATHHRQRAGETARPRDQTRPRRAARHRVRGAAAAVGARAR